MTCHPLQLCQAIAGATSKLTANIPPALSCQPSVCTHTRWKAVPAMRGIPFLERSPPWRLLWRWFSILIECGGEAGNKRKWCTSPCHCPGVPCLSHGISHLRTFPTGSESGPAHRPCGRPLRVKVAHTLLDHYSLRQREVYR